MDGRRIDAFLEIVQASSWPKRPPIQRVPEHLSVRVKRPGREADRSPYLVRRLQMHGAIPLVHSIPSWRAQGQILVEVEGNVLNGARINCQCDHTNRVQLAQVGD